RIALSKIDDLAVNPGRDAVLGQTFYITLRKLINQYVNAAITPTQFAEQTHAEIKKFLGVS
ncbi:hypothetical protein, partial [Legionella tunisiensis]|uniref:hypothetical protein n=1 Tax=Legionella tunisiensis TaxID=1034944 RepID=UPI000592D271